MSVCTTTGNCRSVKVGLGRRTGWTAEGVVAEVVHVGVYHEMIEFGKWKYVKVGLAGAGNRLDGWGRGLRRWYM
jgi:hypothetical protein